MTTRRAARVVIPVAVLGVAAGLGGCKAESSYSTSQWSTQSAPPLRQGVGDSLGTALFLRQVQLAKSVQFQTSPTFASETTE